MKVAVGLGVSGIVVSVGGADVGVDAAAVSVNSDITVIAAEVRIALTSGAGSTGVAGAHAVIINAKKRSLRVLFMSPRFIIPLRQ
jgi:phage baseplate assembly protein gpV